MRPGPGEYDSNYKKIGSDGVKVFISGYRKEAKANDIPGPGMYNPNDAIIKETIRGGKMSMS